MKSRLICLAKTNALHDKWARPGFMATTLRFTAARTLGGCEAEGEDESSTRVAHGRRERCNLSLHAEDLADD